MSVKSILSNKVCLEERYIPDYEDLRRTIEILKNGGHRIVLTQGVYDLIHDGHTRYINKAKDFGDILVVAVDSDAYTRLRKQKENERRPAQPFEVRLEIVSNLRSVDIVTVRDVDKHVEDPYHVIKIIRPDVMIMSKSTKDVDEKDYNALKEFCGRVEVLESQSPNTTSMMLRDLLLDGATGLVDHVIQSIQDYFEKSGRTISFNPNKNGGKKNVQSAGIHSDTESKAS